MKKILSLLTISLIIVSCGKDFINKDDLDDSTGGNVRLFQMSTNEKLILNNKVVKIVNLYDILPHLDSLPLEKESFFEVYDNLALNQNLYKSKTVVLVKTTDCLTPIGYCQAYYLR